ncbi:hypothetical protein GCM10009847_02420 [Leucobacter tardus]|uniref:Alpha/beta fold hydrolase n=1 Tax=Leucobacter tardus TaxID=501483 RepID=A0A939TIS5_9MICO|nr:alpha/beta fold hydrolase [Leucobacter tardus]MBO2988451.1 alpha/beta fold hydrolase [Leucobacter tardus]
MRLPEVRLTAPVGRADAPLVVLGHSIGTGPLIWEQVIPHLAAEYRVSLLTLPGHGSAPVPTDPFTFAELADAVAEAISGIASAHVRYAGVSIGGALALELALRHPDLCDGVAAIASAAQLGGAEHWTERAALVRSQSTSALVGPSSRVWFGPNSVANQPDLSGRILHALQDTPDEGYARCAEALATYDVRNRLGEIRVPVLAMGGEFDTVGPEEAQDEIVAGVVHGRKCMIADAAHQPPAEQPDAVARELLSFFAEVGR